LSECYLSGKIRTIYPSVFKKPEVINELHRLHDNFVLVPADKASINIVFVSKKLPLWMSYLPLLVRTPLILEPILQRMEFFKITFLFKTLSTFLKIKISLNYITFIGFQNCIQILTKIHCWFQEVL
jgi:hypothetical protein